MRVERAVALLLAAGLTAACAPAPEATPEGLRALRVGAVLGDDGSEGFARAERVRPFVFPADHGAHPAYRSEWWYLTVVLEDAAGNTYGVQFTLFRQALRPPTAGDDGSDNPWQNGQAYMAHLGVTDVAGGEHVGRARFARGHPELAGVTVPPLAAYIEDWSLRTEPGASGAEGVRFLLDAVDRGETGARLRLEQTRPMVLQGDAGLSAKGDGQASYYFSMPRLATRGELLIDGETVPVTGWGWLDREWSTSVLSGAQIGWDWFALQLDDGRDLMAFRLRRADGTRDPYDHGALVAADGSYQKLTPEDFELTPQRFWQDETGAAWPVAWQLAVRHEGGEERIGIEAMLDDQVMALGVVYWEGLVLATRDGEPVGRGSMELTGYRD